MMAMLNINAAMAADGNVNNGPKKVVPTNPKEYGLSVGGVSVTNYNCENVTGTTIKGSVQYDPETSTLTLNGATITGEGEGGIVTGKGTEGDELTSLKIVLVGDNKIRMSQDAVLLTKPTTITGEGTLDVDLTGVQDIAPIAVSTQSGCTSLTISGGCKLTVSHMAGNAATTLVVDNATVIGKGTLSGFGNLTLKDVDILSPEGAAYGEYEGIKALVKDGEPVEAYEIGFPFVINIPGDVNGDGKVNVGDIMAVINVMAGQGQNINKDAADVNNDGKVNVGDIMAVINIMAEKN